jgi:hypothetical protein
MLANFVRFLPNFTKADGGMKSVKDSQGHGNSSYDCPGPDPVEMKKVRMAISSRFL